MRGLILFVAAFPGLALAEPPSTHHFTFENDSFFDVDRYYTNGIQWTSERRPDARPDWAPSSWGPLSLQQTSVGQLIYTPGEITIRGPQPFDRPYAGLLYGERAWRFLAEDGLSMTTLTARLGVTGPPSLAEQTQKLVHRLLGRATPQGWEFQVPARLAGIATLERRVAVPALAFDGAALQERVSVHGRIAAGNLQSYVAAGAMLTIGQHLPVLPPAPPAIGNTAAPDDAHCLVDGLRCTAYAGAEWRWVANNLFIDNPGIRLRHEVRDIVAGLRLSWPARRWFLQYQATWRSREFSSPLPVYAHRFAALTLGTEF